MKFKVETNHSTVHYNFVVLDVTEQPTIEIAQFRHQADANEYVDFLNEKYGSTK